MKPLLLLTVMLMTASLYAQNASDRSMEKVSWLTGSWKRTNSRPGFSGFEKWDKQADKLVGWGITMKGKDTSYVEKLQIVSKENELYYVADVPENKEPVYFKFTALSENGFVCENAANDFPKKIEYKKNGNKVLATISGGGKSVDYVFEKM
jgi:hypothetical protein